VPCACKHQHTGPVEHIPFSNAVAASYASSGMQYGNAWGRQHMQQQSVQKDTVLLQPCTVLLTSPAQEDELRPCRRHICLPRVHHSLPIGQPVATQHSVRKRPARGRSTHTRNIPNDVAARQGSPPALRCACACSLSYTAACFCPAAGYVPIHTAAAISAAGGRPHLRTSTYGLPSSAAGSSAT
jgi:hypothetical protein